MVKIYYGDPTTDNYIYNPNVFFNHTYEDSWMTEDLTKRMIEDVDKSEVAAPNVINSPFLGQIPPERLSGGVKTLILMAHDTDHIFNASACGDNCAKWILYLGDRQDFTIRLGYLMDFGQDPFTVEIANTGKIVHTMLELDDEVISKRLLWD